MNSREYLLTQLASECVELSQEAMKSLQFGLANRKPGTNFSNEDRLIEEYIDVIGTFQLLIDLGIIHFPIDGSVQRGVDLKIKKINFYLDLAKKEGRVVDDNEQPKTFLDLAEQQEARYAAEGGCVSCGSKRIGVHDATCAVYRKSV